MKSDVIMAHKHSSKHRDEVLSSKVCGCFYCLTTFVPIKIKEWTDKEQTAVCPKCAIDSVIGSKSGYPITKKFLVKMHEYWFGVEKK